MAALRSPETSKNKPSLRRVKHKTGQHGGNPNVSLRFFRVGVLSTEAFCTMPQSCWVRGTGVSKEMGLLTLNDAPTHPTTRHHDPLPHVLAAAGVCNASREQTTIQLVFK